MEDGEYVAGIPTVEGWQRYGKKLWWWTTVFYGSFEHFKTCVVSTRIIQMITTNNVSHGGVMGRPGKSRAWAFRGLP